jgi:CheY-like chemotaxis protein
LAKDSANQESAEFLSIIKSSGDLLMHLLNDIIDIAKIEEGKIPIEKAPFRFHDIVNNAISPFKLKAGEKGLYLIIDFDAIPENLIGDYHRFSQVLINLVSNAIKFTDKGGVKIKFSKVENPNLAEGAIMLKCSVEDTGIGISDEAKGKLFKSFMQADSSITRRFGGSGLGLTISKDLVNLMGGEMGISNTKQYGEGSEFYFTIFLEVQQGNVNTDEQNAVRNEIRNYKFEHTLNILVVDDDIINQKLMKKVLGDMNCNVTVAGDGEQAIQQLLEKQFDAVLMDVEMPKMNGYEATRIIREQLNSKLPIIGLTAHAEEINRQQGMTAGMNGFIVKPINEELIFKTIYKFTHRD